MNHVMWLGKYLSDGTLTSWPSFSPATLGEIAENTAIGSDGSVYVIGTFDPSEVDDDIFIGKINPAGDLVWSNIVTLPSDRSIYGRGLGITIEGENVYATGDMNGQIWVQKFNAGDGTVVWPSPTLIASPFEGFRSSSNSGTDVRVDSLGNIVVAGSVTQLVSPPNRVTSYHWLGKLDSTGAILWTRTYEGGDCYESSCGLALDASNNIYVAIAASQGAYNPRTESFPPSPVVQKYDPDGTPLAFLTVANPASGTYNAGYDVALDVCGNIYVAGVQYRLYPRELQDLRPWIGVFSPTFEPLFSYTFSGLDIFSYNMFRSGGFPGSGAARAATSITLDRNGSFYLTGYYHVGDVPLVPSSTPFDTNIWTLKFTPGSNPFAPRVTP